MSLADGASARKSGAAAVAPRSSPCDRRLPRRWSGPEKHRDRGGARLLVSPTRSRVGSPGCPGVPSRHIRRDGWLLDWSRPRGWWPDLRPAVLVAESTGGLSAASARRESGCWLVGVCDRRAADHCRTRRTWAPSATRRACVWGGVSPPGGECRETASGRLASRRGGAVVRRPRAHGVRRTWTGDRPVAFVERVGVRTGGAVGRRPSGHRRRWASVPGAIPGGGGGRTPPVPGARPAGSLPRGERSSGRSPISGGKKSADLTGTGVYRQADD